MTVAMNTRNSQPDAKSALAARRENGGVATNTLADQIRSMEAQYQMAMPRGAEATQLVRDALTALRANPKLAECEQASVLGSLMTCAQLGLRPGVLGHAWLLPFWDNKTRSNKAQLVVGYQGLIELALRSGKISSLIARTVFANDEFSVDYGLADTLIHRPNLFQDRGEPIAYYAIAKFTSGGHAFIVMTQKEMLAYRQKHAKARTREGKIFGPWEDNFEGMAHKTCIRQLSKYMPKSTELAIAIAADEGVRVDIRPDVDAAEATEHPEVFEGEVVDGPEVAPMGDERRKRMFALFNEAGLTERDDQLAFIAEATGTDYASRGEVGRVAGEKVIARLEHQQRAGAA
ncbi:recombination protein RecT [Dactylosporangium sucinum]|uniref:Uncharacterized protein n=1 Tax=Dactylosporangium sucinum TaxID=1424081 RepID=A0A917X285_9ACTN|nr:recombination protein RecT [Dactylosporangium sucinum]GGM53784.1 hypothetical protein GCM10007977_064240 [Dactylosporangium sucinum]